MHFNALNRSIHRWVCIVIALPVIVIICSGLLLQTKRYWSPPPPEIRGTGGAPAVGFDAILAAVQTEPSLGVRGWQDIIRVDIRPGRALARVSLRRGWDAQVDLGTGRLIGVEHSRSEFVESLHTGEFFGGFWTRFGLFLPSAVGLLVLWLSGLWMFFLPYIKRRRRSHAEES